MRYRVLYESVQANSPKQLSYIDPLRSEALKLITEYSPPTESISAYLHVRGLYTKNLIAKAWCSIYYPKITLSEKDVFILRLTIPNISFRQAHKKKGNLNEI